MQFGRTALIDRVSRLVSFDARPKGSRVNMNPESAISVFLVAAARPEPARFVDHPANAACFTHDKRINQ